MASSQQVESLRAIVTRISATNVNDLPRILHTLTTILLRCKSILSNVYDDPKTKASQAAQLVARLKKQVGALLNDKSPGGRLCGIVLAKTAIETGGYEILKTCGGWLQAMLSTLNKPDPPTTKRLCIVVLTKALRAMHNFQTLIREIGTPILQALVPTCLNLVAPKANSTKTGVYRHVLLGVVLESFVRLLPKHPTIFRSYHEQLLSLLRPLIVEGSKHAGVAQRLHSLLHYTASKQGQGTQWNATLDQILDEIHSVTTQVYRSVLEDWQSIAGYRTTKPNYTGEPGQVSSLLGLPQFRGIDASCDRLRHMLDILRVFCISETASAITLPLGRLFDLLHRILAVVPARSKSSSGSRPNEQVGQEERTILFSELPLIHATTLRTLTSLLNSTHAFSFPVIQDSLDRMQWLFEYEGEDDMFRHNFFAAAEVLFRKSGSNFRKMQITGLQKVIRAACTDLLPSTESTNTGDINPTRMTGTTLLQTEASGKTSGISSGSVPETNVKRKASSFLTTLLSTVPDMEIPRSLRTLIDRAAILTSDKDLMIASILNCTLSTSGQGNSSILIFLARAYPSDPIVESILRPRMPAVMLGSKPEEVNSDESDNEIDIPEEYIDPVLDPGDWRSQGVELKESDYMSGVEGTVDPALENLSNGNGVNETDHQAPVSAHVAPELSTISGPASKAANLSGMAASTRKRAISNGQVSPKPKRVHFDLEGETTEQHLEVSEAEVPSIFPLPKIEDSLGSTETQDKIATVHKAEDALSNNTQNSDSDDDSDFEIPPLVLKGEEEDEDSESEAIDMGQ